MAAKEKLGVFLKNKMEKSDTSSLSELETWIRNKYSEKLNVISVNGQSLSWILVTEKHTKCDGPSQVQLQIGSDKTFKLKVLGRTKIDGYIDTSPYCADYELQTLLAQMSSAQMIICPGIKEYDAIKKQLGYDPLHVRKWGANDRVDSENCSLWHKPGKSLKAEYANLCQPCLNLKYHVKQLHDRTQEGGSPMKRASVNPRSTRPLKTMSPRSQTKRRLNQNRERRDLKKLLKKMKATDVELNDKQHEEMSKITKSIETSHSQELENVITEASGHNEHTKKYIKQIWGLDTNDRMLFESDQNRNLTGHRGNRWNTITYRIALAIFIRSPAAYKALKSFNILNLPSKRSLQTFVGKNNEGPGKCDSYLSEQMKTYSAMCDELKSKDKPAPDGFGALIFDEVKVVSKLLFNSKSNSLVGLAMSPDEFTCLHDIYMHVNNNCQTQHTNYILQFLWRDFVFRF